MKLAARIFILLLCCVDFGLVENSQMLYMFFPASLYL